MMPRAKPASGKEYANPVQRGDQRRQKQDVGEANFVEHRRELRSRLKCVVKRRPTKRGGYSRDGGPMTDAAALHSSTRAISPFRSSPAPNYFSRRGVALR